MVTSYDRRIRRPISKARLSNLGFLTSCLVLDHDSSANPCTSCEVNSLNLIRRFKIFLNIRQTSTKWRLNSTYTREQTSSKQRRRKITNSDLWNAWVLQFTIFSNEIVIVNSKWPQFIRINMMWKVLYMHMYM